MRVGRIILGVAVVVGLLIARAAGGLPGSSLAPTSAQELPADAALGHPNLNAVLWVQTSAEYVGSALQAYTLAQVMLDRALDDPTWTAALEQDSEVGYEVLPTAIILDVDETVLDNSPNQARQILDDTEFNRADWHAWVREEQAQPVPGALEFTRYAADRGVTVFYVTNRRHEVEPATRNNLQALGFPLESELDTIYTRDERQGWGSDKGTRRQAIADSYRILLLVGDNLGDFLSDVSQSVEVRKEMAQRRAQYWGRRWIVLPNPEYGSWEGSLIGFQYGLPVQEKRRAKAAALDPKR